ncbi:MAG: acetate/propionate family kinase [Ilumatobacteraceae bacterium]
MDKDAKNNILVLNAGSSSIKFAVYTWTEEIVEKISGSVKNIGYENVVLSIHRNDKEEDHPLHAPDFAGAIKGLMEWLENEHILQEVQAVGHRIVHGLHHSEPALITDTLLSELQSISHYDPDHMPVELDIIRQISKAYPDLLQYACFDTSFHTTLPAVAKTYAIPSAYFGEGIQRYGFHGLSYAYLMEQLSGINPEAAKGKVILAHLGNGASLAAVEHGQCQDTSMGFTPAAGIPMSTRSGDLDPGIAWYMMQKGIDAKKFNQIINHESGLLGISGISGNMQELLQKKETNEKAALAVDIFCYQIRKFIGAYMAVLGGLDALVFSGGIGENSAAIRAAIGSGLGYAGIFVDEVRNVHHETIISGESSKVSIYVIPTNEEKMIATAVAGMLKNKVIPEKTNAHERPGT